MRELREAGLKTGVVSSSRNCAAVLELAGISNLFDAIVDGETSLELGLPGKPAPDAFLEGARRLDVSPGRSVVVEDALAGVEAGRAGGFALVIGVDRGGQADALATHGAHVVVSDLGELLADSRDDVHRSGPRTHRLRAAARRILTATEDFPVDPWRLVERAYNPTYAEQTETLFALSNGYLGMRGSSDGGEPASRPVHPAQWLSRDLADRLPGDRARLRHDWPDDPPRPGRHQIRLFVDEEPVTCETTEVHEYTRVLDMSGPCSVGRSSFGCRRTSRLRVHSERLVSLAQRHLACIRYEVTALGMPAHVMISSELNTPEDGDDELALDPGRAASWDLGTLLPDMERVDGVHVIRTFRTQGSGLAVAAGMDHEVDAGAAHMQSGPVDTARARVVFEARCAVGETVGLTKWLAYHHDDTETRSDLADRTALTLDRARTWGWSHGSRSTSSRWRTSGSAARWSGRAAAQRSRPSTSTCSRCFRRP